MQTFKQIKTRIHSIENARKVTSAMQMVSATKLNRANNRLFACRFYFDKIESLLRNIASSYDSSFNNPLIKGRLLENKIILCVVTSDGGLCGAYNNNVIHLSENFIKEKQKEEIKLILIGKKGFNYFKNSNMPILDTYSSLNIKRSDNFLMQITDNLIKRFLSGKTDGVYVAYTHFETALSIKPRLDKTLNIGLVPGEKINYIFESNPEDILEKVVANYVYARFKLIMLEAAASEHAARTMAMKAATENAKELLHDLVLLRNKVRQTNITKDIIEIISSAESLRRG